jgi:acetyl-CoA hydrolase/transferase-like protein
VSGGFLSPQFHADVETCADAIIAETGKRIVLALPLGLGKANHIANALYARAAADPGIDLEILTGLTLEKRQDGPEIARRLADPIVARLFGGYPELAYAEPLRRDRLPPNIKVAEFYMMPGRWLGVGPAQRNYVSANYTEVPRVVRARRVNVIAQLVAKRASGAGTELSLSSNSDLTLELLAERDRRRAAGDPFVFAAEVNGELPFMGGDAALPATAFDHVLEAPAYEFPLFAPPKEAVTPAHHATALHIARLVRDGGTLQIGIGSLGDAIAWALILRHAKNVEFTDMLARLAPDHAIGGEDETPPFARGLYAVTEMFADAFLELYRAGILRRRASDGALLHGAFFLGPKDFYRALREMPETERAAFRMTKISFTNEIGGPDEAQKRADRRHARFINSAMIVTLLGEVVSDTREDGQVVSGVGGQYNLVAQAHALEDARAIIAVNATRMERGRPRSNIRFSYGACTLPRHLRDIIATEYGIADLRGKSDRDVIVAMLAIADSRFQPELLRQAKEAGKIEPTYEIPAPHRRNLPERLHEALFPARQMGLLPDYPFGTDLDEVERRLVAALQELRHATATPFGLARALGRSLALGPPGQGTAQALARLALDRPATFKDKLLRRLVLLALERPGPWAG